MNSYPRAIDLYDMNKTILDMNYHYWIEHVLFSFNWWFFLVLMIVPWFIWWKFVDKKRLVEISLIGAMAAVLANNFDTIGSTLLFWSYNYKLVQMTPSLASIDLSLLPVSYMLIYQIFPKWKTYFIVHVIFAAGGSFVIEPLFGWMGIYTLHSWRHIYSFPIYILMGLFFKWLILKMQATEK